MKDRDIEKLLKSFHKVKAPPELDNRMTPYLEKGHRRSLVPVYATLLIAIVVIFYGIFSRKRKSSMFLYEPLYAAHTVFGYYELKEPVYEDLNIRVLMDGSIVIDSMYMEGDTLKLSLDLSPGLHYIIIESYNINGGLSSIKTIDLYSL